MKSFQILTLLALIATAMAFAPNVTPKSKYSEYKVAPPKSYPLLKVQ